MMTPDKDVVQLVSRDTDDSNDDGSGEISDTGGGSTPTDKKELIADLNWNQFYNKETRRCLNGTDWCNEELLVPKVNGDETFYNKTVLGTTRMFIRLHLGLATFFLRLGVGFRKVRIGRVVVDHKEMLTALRPR